MMWWPFGKSKQDHASELAMSEMKGVIEAGRSVSESVRVLEAALNVDKIVEDIKSTNKRQPRNGKACKR